MDLKTDYNNPKFSGSYSGVSRFYKAAKEKYPSLQRKTVKKFLKSEDAYTLHAEVKKPRRYRRVYTKGIGYLYQLDLIDMSALSKYNKNYCWIVMLIDTFSKKLYAFKTKNKGGKTITDVLKPILTVKRPKKLETDGGTEFKNKLFTALLKKLNIQTYSISSVRKCSIVERANRTIKTKMYRSFTARGSRVWIDILDDLIDTYNSSYHSSIKMKPNQVSSSTEAKVRKNLYPPLPPKSPPKFKLNDSVRITRKKSIFQKGYEQSWSYEVFFVSVIKDTNPITYGIKDYNGSTIVGSFYASELQSVDKSSDIFPIERIIKKRTRQGKTQFLVKYSGYSDDFNSWVDQSDLFKI